MSHMRRDIFGAVAVGILAVVLFVMFMGSMVMLGQSAGRMVVARTVSPPDSSTSADSTRAAGPRRVRRPLPVETTAAIDSLLSVPPRYGTPQAGPYDGVPVLCYHYLRGRTNVGRLSRVFLYVVLSLPVLNDNEVWTVSQGAFEKQMRYLHENGYQTVTLDDLTEWQYGRRPLPQNAVILTFDDADRSVYEYAYPILRRYGFKATLFVITDEVGKQWRGLDVLSWEELREMKESGVFEIASHSGGMHYKVGERGRERPVFLSASEGEFHFEDGSTWEDALWRDLVSSRDAIWRGVGEPCRYLAWPYGHSNDAVERIALAAGFDRTLLLRDGLNPPFVGVRGQAGTPLERLRITRFAVSARTSMRAFRQMLSGEYQTAQGY